MDRKSRTLTRRDVLKLGLGAGAGVMLGRLPLLAQSATPILRTIPSSGEKLPAIGLGSSRTFSVGSSAKDRGPIKEVLRLFAELGGTLLDTAPTYGRSEAVAGDLAAELGLQDKIFWATKISRAGDRQAGIKQMETSMERFRSDHIELEQVHNLGLTNTHLATLREWKKAGRVSYLGITTSSLRQFDEVEKLLKNETLDFVQLNYSLGTRQAEDRLLPLAQDRGVAVLVNRPFERGRMFRAVSGQSVPEWAAEFDAVSWGQFFLKYVLSHPAVTCPIPATSDPKHLKDNMGAMYGGLPDQKMRKRMVDFVDAL